jgi:hypothetical protein
MTEYPFAANTSAAARPMPLPAPVMMTDSLKPALPAK